MTLGIVGQPGFCLSRVTGTHTPPAFVPWLVRTNACRWISGWPGDAVSYRCRRCDRHGTFGKAELLARLGDKRLTELLLEAAAGCPRMGNTRPYELCGAVFVIPRQELTPLARQHARRYVVADLQAQPHCRHTHRTAA